MDTSTRSSSSPRPDFFIVGAPKCGTTAMYEYLSAHPEIGMCSRKEVHHFAPDLFPDKLDRSAYLALFPDAPAKRVGEASVWYLYSERAAEEINPFAPDADIIIMLRNHPDMLHSLYSQWVYNGREWAQSFEDALALDPDREAGLVERRFTPDSYRQAATYAEQVERYLSTFGADRVHIVIFDDFSSDPAREYRRVCEFLGVDAGFVPDLDVVNAHKRPRSRVLTEGMASPPAAGRSLIRRLLPRRARARLWKTLVKLNTRSERRAPMPDQLRRQLQTEFEPDVQRLSALIGRDLSPWSLASR